MHRTLDTQTRSKRSTPVQQEYIIKLKWRNFKNKKIEKTIKRRLIINQIILKRTM